MYPAGSNPTAMSKSKNQLNLSVRHVDSNSKNPFNLEVTCPELTPEPVPAIWRRLESDNYDSMKEGNLNWPRLGTWRTWEVI